MLEEGRVDERCSRHVAAGTSYKFVDGTRRSASITSNTRASLTTQPGVSVQQDLALVSLLGLTHVERNAHHFIDGMSVAPQGEQEAFLKAHPKLYHREPGKPVRLSAQSGRLDLSSLDCAGFAVGAEMDFNSLRRMPDAPKEKIQ